MDEPCRFLRACDPCTCSAPAKYGVNLQRVCRAAETKRETKRGRSLFCLIDVRRARPGDAAVGPPSHGPNAVHPGPTWPGLPGSTLQGLAGRWTLHPRLIAGAASNGHSVLEENPPPLPGGENRALAGSLQARTAIGRDRQFFCPTRSPLVLIDKGRWILLGSNHPSGRFSDTSGWWLGADEHQRNGNLYCEEAPMTKPTDFFCCDPCTCTLPCNTA